VQGLVAFQYKQSDSAGGLYSVTNIAEKEDDFTAHRRQRELNNQDFLKFTLNIFVT
jgi:hypothetical protein